MNYGRGLWNGKLSVEITKNLPEGSVLRIDLSKTMVTFARNHYHPEKFPNLTFIRMDANELSFGSEFGVVFSNAALHWIKAPEAALGGFLKNLKYDGVLLTQFGRRENTTEVLKTIDSILGD